MTKDEMKMTFTQTVTREEMKNRISMALKDPILQQGFEIICKNLAELEKELKIWHDTTDARLTLYFQQKQKIADLEKENAELKEKLNFSTQYYQGEKAKDQLTKAKYLLKQLVNAFPKSYSDVVKDTLNEARKFVEE